MTEEQELLLDCWNQFAHYTDTMMADGKPKEKWDSGGLSTLECVEKYLRRYNLLNDDGSPK